MLIILSLAAMREAEVSILKIWLSNKTNDNMMFQLNWLDSCEPKVYRKIITSEDWKCQRFDKVEDMMYKEVGMLVAKRMVKSL